jgi:hypothetical protein
MCFVLNLFYNFYDIKASTHVSFVLQSLQSPYRARTPTVPLDSADAITLTEKRALTLYNGATATLCDKLIFLEVVSIMISISFTSNRLFTFIYMQIGIYIAYTS